MLALFRRHLDSWVAKLFFALLVGVFLLWGAHAVHARDIGSFEEMIAKGKRMALRHGFGEAGSKLITMAGVPFGTPGATNLLHVVTLAGDELKRHTGDGD